MQRRATPLFGSMIADGGLRLIQTLPWVDARSRLVPAQREGLREAVSWILVVAAAEPRAPRRSSKAQPLA